jgi:hypothetical protein
MSKKVGCVFDHRSGVVLVISGRAHGRFALIGSTLVVAGSAG